MSAPFRRNVFSLSTQILKKSNSLTSYARQLFIRKSPKNQQCLPALVQLRCDCYSTATPPAIDQDEEDVLYKAVEIEVKGHDVAVINSYEKFLSMAARELDVTISKIWTPPRVIERYTLLKSVHIFKKHRVQYETRTNYRTIQVKHVTGSTAETFLEYIQRNLPEGMAMKVTKHRIERLPQHIQKPALEPPVLEGTTS